MSMNPSPVLEEESSLDADNPSYEQIKAVLQKAEDRVSNVDSTKRHTAGITLNPQYDFAFDC